VSNTQTVHAAPFDPLARDYDADFTDTPVGRVLREMVWWRSAALLRAGRVLELGCGTGEDACQLAAHGLDVVATDVSAEMVAVASRKARRRECSERASFHCLPMERVGATFAGQRFDGVFSNFGAVNCVDDVAGLARDLGSLLTPNAPLLWVVMGRHVPWEWLWFISRGQGRKAVRRLRKDGVPWRGVTVRYPTPDQLARTLSPHFEVTGVTPLGCVLPPTYAAGWLNRSPRALRVLTRFETAAQRWPALARVADHYIIEARKS
jgi:SAM-dependent methyltransferase